jgi:DedD protein
MDTALKQRLVGAAVLVLLAVIFVPWFLSSPQQMNYKRDLPLPIPSEPQRPDDLVAAPRNAPVDSEVMLPDAAPATNAATVDAPLAPAPLEPVADAGSTSPLAPVSSSAAIQPSEQAKPVAAKPEPVPQPTAEPTRLANPGGRYALQLATLRNAERAERLKQQVESQGLPATIEQRQSGAETLYRVRSGPFNERDAADRARAALTLSLPDILPSLVELGSADAPAAPVAPAVAKVGATTGWAVQVGRFSEAGRAEKLVTQLRAKGFVAFVAKPGPNPADFRVRVGPELARGNADALKQRLIAAGFEGFVVSHP